MDNNAIKLLFMYIYIMCLPSSFKKPLSNHKKSCKVYIIYQSIYFEKNETRTHKYTSQVILLHGFGRTPIFLDGAKY